MKILILVNSMIIATFISSISVANNGVGNGQGNRGFGPSMGTPMPPGLQNKGTPPGLHMQNKTPYGWTRGHKYGWDKWHHHYYNYPNHHDYHHYNHDHDR